MSDISQHLIEQVKAANAARHSVRIHGAGTKQGLGRATTEQDGVISTLEHSGIVTYKPAELIMTARAGTCLSDIDAALAENKQVLACDPRRFNGRATIGGSLAANQSGPARPWLGALRDQVLGVKLINGKGEHLQFGGQVLKNVAGYDVSRLQAGAMGTLGVMTEISFKVLPKLACCRTVVKDITAADAITLMNQLSGTAKPITGACWQAGRLHIRLEGAATAVEATAQQWRDDFGMVIQDKAIAEVFWAELREQKLAFFAEPEKPLWRFSVNAAAQTVLPDEDWLFNWAGAERWLRGDFQLASLSEIAKEQGGEVQLYSGGDRSGDVSLVHNEPLKALLRNVKQSFDPQSIFNSGRLYRWL